MFQYQKEVIINSATTPADSYGTSVMVPRFVAVAPAGTVGGRLTILRSGTYNQENLVDGIIYKTPGVAGATGQVTINAAGISTAEVGVYRLSIYIGMDNKFLSDFAYANWYKFGRPVIVEFEVVAGDTSATIAQKIRVSLKEAVPTENVFLYINTAETGTSIVAKLTDPYAYIKAVTLEKFDPDANACNSCFGDYVPLWEANAQGTKTNANVTIVSNTEPFGTGQWLIENLRFPSMPNLRYNALYQDERPVPGALYTEYSFLYKTKRDIGGVSVVGQANETITRHIYYVQQGDALTQFEAALATAFGAAVTDLEIEAGQFVLPDNDTKTAPPTGQPAHTNVDPAPVAVEETTPITPA